MGDVTDFCIYGGGCGYSAGRDGNMFGGGGKRKNETQLQYDMRKRREAAAAQARGARNTERINALTRALVQTGGAFITSHTYANKLVNDKDIRADEVAELVADINRLRAKGARYDVAFTGALQLMQQRRDRDKLSKQERAQYSQIAIPQTAAFLANMSVRNQMQRAGLSAGPQTPEQLDRVRRMYQSTARQTEKVFSDPTFDVLPEAMPSEKQVKKRLREVKQERRDAKRQKRQADLNVQKMHGIADDSIGMPDFLPSELVQERSGQHTSERALDPEIAERLRRSVPLRTNSGLATQDEILEKIADGALAPLYRAPTNEERRIEEDIRRRETLPLLKRPAARQAEYEAEQEEARKERLKQRRLHGWDEPPERVHFRRRRRKHILDEIWEDQQVSAAPSVYAATAMDVDDPNATESEPEPEVDPEPEVGAGHSAQKRSPSPPPPPSRLGAFPF